MVNPAKGARSKLPLPEFLSIGVLSSMSSLKLALAVVIGVIFFFLLRKRRHLVALIPSLASFLLRDGHSLGGEAMRSMRM